MKYSLFDCEVLFVCLRACFWSLCEVQFAWLLVCLSICLLVYLLVCLFGWFISWVFDGDGWSFGPLVGCLFVWLFGWLVG